MGRDRDPPVNRTTPDRRNNMVWAEPMLDAFERVGWGALLIGAEGRVILGSALKCPQAH